MFAKIRDSRDRLLAAYLRAMAIAYALVSPLLTVVVVAAPLLIPLLFGNQWGSSVRVAQALALAAILTLGATLDHGLFYGLGRPGTWLVYAVAIDALTVIVTALVVSRGLDAVAVAFVGVALIATAVRWVLVGKVLNCPTPRVARPFGSAAVATAVSALAGHLVLQAVTNWPTIVALIVTTAVIVITSLFVVGLLQKPILEYCLDSLPVPAQAERPLRKLLRLSTPTT